MSIKERTLEILLDLEWHCSICDLPASQAKTYHILKQEGWQFDSTSDRGDFSTRHCPICKRQTSHRRLISTEQIDRHTARSNLTQSQRQQILVYYQNMESFYSRQKPSRELEIDHRFPQIRWAYSDQLPYDRFEDNFMLLTRSNNLLKSRACEKCVGSGKRGSPIGIEFWYDGNEYWEADFSDPEGCIGCFWHDPDEWRRELHKLIA